MAAASLKQAGRPVSCVVVASATTTTITDILTYKGIDDPESIEHMSGNKRVPYYVEGKKVEGFTITTTDASAVTALPKHTICTSAILTVECAIPAGSAATQPTEQLKFTLSDCIQLTDNSPGGDSSGKPGEYTLTFQACQDPTDNSEGACTVTFAAAG